MTEDEVAVVPKRVRTLVPKWLSPASAAELVSLSNQSGLLQIEIMDALVFGWGAEAVERARRARESTKEARLNFLSEG